MSNIPPALKYASTHEWVRVEDDGTVTVGITDHAQALLGDVVYLELPEVGSEINASDEIGVIESVKAASDIYSPVSGTVMAINEKLIDAPLLVNSDPYGEGWLYTLNMTDEDELDELLDAKGYSEQVLAEGH